jgi:hypothetical protein
VLLVAVAALGAGLVGGLMFLRQPRHGGGLDNATLPAPAAPPPAVDSEADKPNKKTKKHDPSEGASAAPELPVADPAATVTASAATDPAPAPAPDAGATEAGARPERHPNVDLLPAPLPSAEAAPAPTGPWQKPDWAIPDNEIKIHRGPDQQDEKIVIPPDEK